MRKRKFRNIVAILAGIMILTHLFEVNFENLAWEENKSSYLGIISMLLLVIAMIFSNKHDSKERIKSCQKAKRIQER